MRKNLSVDEINGMTSALQASGALRDDYDANKPVKAVKATLSALGLDPVNYNVKYYHRGEGFNPDKEAATFTVLRIGSNKHPDLPGHSQEGDAQGNFAWDTYNGMNDPRKQFPQRQLCYTHVVGIKKKE